MSNQNNAQNIQVQPHTGGANIGTANTAGIAYGGVGNTYNTYNNCVFQAPVAGAYHHAGGAAEQRGASTDPSVSLTVPLEDDSSTSDSDDFDERASTDPSQGPSLSTTVPPVTVTTQDSDQHATPSAAASHYLWEASWDGDLETVRRIVAAGRADVNYRGGWRSRTPVMAAAWSGHRDVVELLVDGGADPSLVDSTGDSALHYACERGHLETVRRIVAAGRADINYRGGVWSRTTPVMRAAEEGHRDVVEFLVGEGADLSLVDSRGDNALHWACRRAGDLETVKLIVSQNVVDVNSRGQWSRTPVMWSAEKGHRDTVEFLVGEGADPSLVDSSGNNVLHYACERGHLETVKLILSLNVVDVNAKNYQGWQTAADWARYNGHQQVLGLLVSHGAVLSRCYCWCGKWTVVVVWVVIVVVVVVVWVLIQTLT